MFRAEGQGEGIGGPGQIDAPGPRIGGEAALPELVGGPADHGRERISGPQVGGADVQMEECFGVWSTRERDPDKHGNPVGGGRGIVGYRKSHCGGFLLRQRMGGGPEQQMEAPGPKQAEGRAQEGQSGPSAGGSEEPQEGRGEKSAKKGPPEKARPPAGDRPREKWRRSRGRQTSTAYARGLEGLSVRPSR